MDPAVSLSLTQKNTVSSSFIQVFLFVWMYNLLIVRRMRRVRQRLDRLFPGNTCSTNMGHGPLMILVFLSVFFGRWNKQLLNLTHERTKNQSSHHDQQQSCVDKNFVVLHWQATFTRLTRILADCRHAKYKSKSDSSSNHTCVCDEAEFPEIDGSRFEAQAEQVESTENC